MSNRPIDIFVFQDAIDASADGESLNVTPSMQTVNVEIISTSTDAMINFEAQVVSDTWQATNGVNIETFNIMTSAPATNGVYQVDLTGVSNLRCRISDMTNGEVTISGRVVS